ncbi:MAG TPA: phospholipid carrier-dependent glycosyltransferase [Steroidobacteraceae bacterium]|nr:phospholipid carrier-dependent glycosyltransferase [Steroidobacteraceae bacterium]
MIERSAFLPDARKLYAALAVFVAVLWLAILPTRPLFNPDEGRYAEIPREMLASGDWVIPHLNGLAYIEKPPLQYWATALSLQLFGPTAFAARLYTALTAIGALLAVWLVARRLWSGGAAWRTAAVLASLSLFPVIGQLLSLDMSLTFFMTVALGAFLSAQSCRPAEARSYLLIAWAATACGVLTKGLVAAAIPAAVLILYSALARDGSPWRRLNLRYGLPLFLLISVPWYWLAARRLPDFLEFFFVHEHFARYLTNSADREQAWWFFGPVFIVGSLPWTFAALRVLATGWRRQAPAGEFDAQLFLWIWVVFVLGFFSLSDSKLIPYVLPALPALALLIGGSPLSVLRRDVLVAAALVLLLGIAAGAASFHLPELIAPSDRSAYFISLAQPLRRVAAVLAVSALFVLARRDRDPTGGAVLLGVGWCIALLLLVRAAAAVAPIYSGAGLAQALAREPRDSVVYSVGTYDQTLPFYLGRTVALVNYRGELDYGLRHLAAADPDAQAGYGSIDEFLEHWSSAGKAYAVMDTEMVDPMSARGMQMRILSRDAQRVLVARH